MKHITSLGKMRGALAKEAAFRLDVRRDDKWAFSKITYKTSRRKVISPTLVEIASCNFLEYWFIPFKVEVYYYVVGNYA